MGSGAITANGGAGDPGGYDRGGGGGAGGRIAIYYSSNPFGGAIAAYGGPGAYGSEGSGGPGGAGTLYLAYTGDVNGDGAVDVIDLLWLIDAFGTYTGDAKYNPACDFNGDGAVDVIDLLYMIDNFGKGA